ncbi:MAG: hypothetical protein PHW33_04505 [Candidatus Portnoybacteria bacterium]|nr:hypothetical protein [Candidatus Portnoybacteria bacterium]
MAKKTKPITLKVEPKAPKDTSNEYLQYVMNIAVSLSDTETKKSEKIRIILETLQKDFEIKRKG